MVRRFRLARLSSASTSTFAAPNWSTDATTRRDNNVSKELKNWVSDMKTATEHVDELMVHVIEWIDGQNALGDVTDAEFHRWANGSGHN